MSFFENLKQKEESLKLIAKKVVDKALQLGADECEVVIGGSSGLSVSSRNQEVENIEYNRDNGTGITVYKNKKKGSASTTDLSEKAIEQCVQSALGIAEHADSDPFAGLPDKELQCTEFKDLALLYENNISADEAVARAISLEKDALKENIELIKQSDGASFDNSINTMVMANSNGFIHASSSSSSSCSIVLLGEAEGKMQRGFGYSVARDVNKLYSNEQIVNEAVSKTIRKLNAKKVKTGKYNIIFSEGAATSLWSILASAISGGAIYRKSSFLCDKKLEQIFPEFVSVHEDPFVIGGRGSTNCDAEGVRVTKSDIIKNGVLQDYLLSSYTARKLGLVTNGHAGSIYNWFVDFGNEHTLSFNDLLATAGEGIVVTGLMGQGVNIINGNYSRGAEGYYFKDGKFVHPVDGITIAGNLKDMFLNMQAQANDFDERVKIQAGSVLIPNMTVSGE